MNAKKDWRFGILVCLSVIAVLAVNILAANKNYGLEGDEVFSYISATSMGGFHKICFLDDQTWYNADYFENALEATGRECFNVKMVIDNQSMDTHPPLYYIFLNFVCSIFEGQFSKWYGIGLNLLFIIIVMAFMYFLLKEFIHNRYLAMVFSSIFCCSQVSVSMVLFIRMYVLLMAWTVLQTWYHIKLIQNTAEEDTSGKRWWKKYIGLAVITILGALTHYYFLVYTCLVSGIYILILLIEKKYKKIFQYISTMIISAGIYIAIYPAVLNHLFFKYRGREAVHKFLKGGTLFGDVISMLHILDKQLFKGMFIPVIVVLGIITFVLLIKKKLEWRIVINGILFIIPSIVYFFGISKASPYVTVRYISPIAPVIFIFIIVWGKEIINCLNVKLKYKKAVCILAVFLSACTSVYFGKEAIKDASFAEKKTVMEKLAKEADDCVYITADEYNWKMWEDYVYYPLFDGLFFIDGRYMNPIRDEKLLQQDSLAIFVDKALDMDEINNYLTQYLPEKEYSIVYETSYITMIIAKGRD